jgi:hypothetical protein
MTGSIATLKKEKKELCSIWANILSVPLEKVGIEIDIPPNLKNSKPTHALVVCSILIPYTTFLQSITTARDQVNWQLVGRHRFPIVCASHHVKKQLIQLLFQ